MSILRKNKNGTFFDTKLHESILLEKKDKILSILKDTENSCELTDSLGRTLLHFAAQYGNKGFARYLIDSGANVDAQDEKNQTPLMYALNSCKKITVRVLLKANADMFIPDILGQCALQKVLYRQQVKKGIHIELLKKVTVGSLNNSKHVASDEFHRDCPLYHFMTLNNAEVTRILLEKGSPVDAKNPVTGETALHSATRLLNLENVKLLLEYNADVNAKDFLGKTSLAHTSPIYEERKALVAMKMFIAAGAILIDHASRVNMLRELLTHGSREIVCTLLQCDIDLLFEDREGLTSLHYLAENSCANILEELPSLNFDMNVRCREGRTMLSYAAQFKNPSSVAFLLDHGVDVNAKDNSQRTPLYYAAHPQYFDRLSRGSVAYLQDCVNCVEILLEHDADPDLFADGDILWIEVIYPHYRESDAILKIFTPVVAKLALLYETSSGNNCAIEFSMRKFIVSYPQLKYTFDLIKRQLEEMKQIKIHDSMTLFDFLTANDKKIARFARNEKFVSNLTELMKEFSSIPYYLQRRFIKISRLSVFRKTYLPVINDVLRKYCNISIDNIAEQIIDCLQKETWNEILL